MNEAMKTLYKGALARGYNYKVKVVKVENGTYDIDVIQKLDHEYATASELSTIVHLHPCPAEPEQEGEYFYRFMPTMPLEFIKLDFVLSEQEDEHDTDTTEDC